MQLNKNGLTFSVDDAEVIRLVLERFNGIEAHIVAASHVPPAIGSEWKTHGGIYAGVMRGRDGAPDYHLIVGPEAEEGLTYQDALDFAKACTAGGFTDWDGHYRKEQALAFANVPEIYKPECYWSKEPHASGSDYAWCQYFFNGTQDNWLKVTHSRVRVVRRSAI